MKDFGQRLLQYRRQAGMSQEELAEKVEVSRQTLSKWETGQSLPDAQKVALVCEVLSITPNELLNIPLDANITKEKLEAMKEHRDWIYEAFWLAMFVCGSMLFCVLFLTDAFPAWWVPIMALAMMLIPTIMFTVKGILKVINRWKKRS